MMSTTVSLFLTLSSLRLCLTQSQYDYFVDRHDAHTNVYHAIPTAGQSTDYVKFLGNISSTDDCISACISHGNKISSNCSSYSYFTNNYPAGDAYKSQCYGRFGDPIWNIMPYNGVNSGRIIYKCISPLNCSLNGACNTNTGNCTCNIGWTGYRCNALNLLPATKGSGYNTYFSNDNKNNYSTWGGAVITDYNNANKNTKYHMFISQMINHCGLTSWTINSQVIHAQSTNGWNSPYKFIEIAKAPFATEPDIVYGNNGEFVLYYEHYTYSNLSPCNCSDGSTSHCKGPSVPQYQESMRYTMNISLPIDEWSEEINIFNETNNDNTHDTNFAMVILKNGSLIGMSREWLNHNGGGSYIYLSKADNWKDNKTYTLFEPDYNNRKLLFPQLTKLYTEDPYLYIDCNGNYHAIFHNMSPNPPNATADGYLGVVGGHAFSMDGITWFYGGASYDNIVKYDDGTTFIAHSRERPHFIFDDDNCTPIALITGVTFGHSDYSFTLLQPVKH
eukprot:366970_1